MSTHIEMNENTTSAGQEIQVLFRKPPAGSQSWVITRAPLKRDLATQELVNVGCDYCCCVMAGSLVMLADGSRQAIETIQAGQMVRTLKGTAVVQKLETVKLGVTRRMIELDSGDGDPLYITDDHPLWTRFADGSEWWGTYNFNHYLFEKESGGGSFLKRDAVPLGFHVPQWHAHVEGWRQVRPVFTLLSPETPVYHLALDQGGSYIANGFVVISHCHDSDVAGAAWNGIEASTLQSA